MIILKYIITFILGIVSASFIIIMLTVLRCGIPVCKFIMKALDAPADEKEAAKKVIKKYYLSLFIDSCIVIIASIIVYFLMKETLIFYLILIAFYTLISFGKTGKTQENLLEVDNALSCNMDYNTSENKHTGEELVRRIMDKSGLSEKISTDICIIMDAFITESKEKGIEKINMLLVPDLKEEGNTKDVATAFAMLINDEKGLTREECLKYSRDIVLEMVGEKEI